MQRMIAALFVVCGRRMATVSKQQHPEQPFRRPPRVNERTPN